MAKKTMEKVGEVKGRTVLTSAEVNHIIRNLNELQERVEELEKQVSMPGPFIS